VTAGNAIAPFADSHQPHASAHGGRFDTLCFSQQFQRGRSVLSHDAHG
jgi:hypothetical protein